MTSLLKILQRHDTYRDLSILIVTALIIGVYLIASTAVISRDGAFYIKRAQSDLNMNPDHALTGEATT
jgi:hypothetical protein